MKSMATKEKALVDTPKNKPRIVYPSASFSSKALPDVKDLKMGDTIEMKARYKVKGMHEGWDDKNEVVCEMDMISCEVTDGPEDFKEAKNRRLSRKDWDEIQAKKSTKNA